MSEALEVKKALSLNLKQLRDQKKQSNGEKTTQIQVAAAIDITQKTYSEIEAGKRWPQHDTLVKLAEYFEVEQTDLVTDKNLIALRDAVRAQKD